MLFPVVMYGCENWSIKKVERWRTDVFELWSSKRLLRVLWTARRSNQSILKETNPKYSLEGLMLKLKLQYFGYLMWRADSMGKTLMLGKTEGKTRRGWQRMRWLGSISGSMDVNLTKLWETVEDRGAWSATVHGVGKSGIWLSNWTTTKYSLNKTSLKYPILFHFHCTAFSVLVPLPGIEPRLGRESAES